jgi:hypothetical protein
MSFRIFVLAIALLGIGIAPANGQTSSARVNSLRNLPHVVVEYSIWTQLPTLPVDTASFRTLLELEVHRLGLPVTPFSERISPQELLSGGLLSFKLTVVPAGTGYAFTTTLELSQPALLQREPIPVAATTWQARSMTGWIGRTDLLRPEVESALRMHLDEFSNAYFSANPR